ncbi:nucleotidyltransferase domain-containing protein [Streptomyces sp. NPDC051909]|uniref:nucleotidyltransferase domain-containing protein n=1 Tax=Streptomyces sp. NPDC051909 TaxID=3154944 RepID=UPI003426ACCC
MHEIDTADWLRLLRERELIPEDCLAVSVVGSVARGWHNDQSDFDIYVVTSNEAESAGQSSIAMPLNPPRVRTEMFYAGDRRWEVTYWLDSQYEQMLAKVSWDAFNRGVAPVRVLAPREELALSRLESCVVLHGAEWFEDRRAHLARTAFRAFLISRSLGAADDCVEDALGQMESGNLESATLSARAALGFAVDALLEGQGEFGSQSPKWRPQRFRAACPPALSFEDYWALETMRGYDPEDPRPWITEVLTICQEISMRVEVA